MSIQRTRRDVRRVFQLNGNARITTLPRGGYHGAFAGTPGESPGSVGPLRLALPHTVILLFMS